MNNKLFCYGILKRGRALDLANEGARFLGEASIKGAVLYGIGPAWGGNNTGGQYRGVGLKLEGEGIAYGDLWEIPDSLWGWLDDIENNGHTYTRQVVEVTLHDEEGHLESVHAWVYVHNYNKFPKEHLIKGGRF